MTDEEQKEAEAHKNLVQMMNEQGVSSPCELVDIEYKRTLKERRQLQRRYKIKTAFQVVCFYAALIVCGILLVATLSYFNIPAGWAKFIEIAAVFFAAALIGATAEYIEKRKAKKHAEEEAANRSVPAELDSEYEELSVSIYKWEYELRQAIKNYNEFSSSDVNTWLQFDETDDLTARKLLKYLDDNKTIIDSYPDKIEAAKERCYEISQFVHKMWPDEKFPAKTIFIPKIYISDKEK